LGQALARYREIGDRRYEAETLTGLGLALLARKEYAPALDQLATALALARDLGDQHLEAITVTTVGRAHLSVGDLAAAREQLHHALALRALVPDPYEEARVHRDLGELAELGDAPDEATHHWHTALRLFEKANAREEADGLAAHLRARPAQPAHRGG
jgi:tetratricopeptide (TPR) repeat protein